jgi:hypothetical protein
MMPLSTDWTALNSKIDAMTPNGNTNVTIGLQLAWQSVAPVAPFNAPAPAPDLDKVIILLTDGDNTQNRWSSTQSIARTDKVCTNAKADNIRSYGPGDPTATSQPGAARSGRITGTGRASSAACSPRRAEPRQSAHRQMMAWRGDDAPPAAPLGGPAGRFVGAVCLTILWMQTQ